MSSTTPVTISLEPCSAAVQNPSNEVEAFEFIDAGADVNEADKNDGRTALFYAVQQSSNENVVRALIDAGADVNKTDSVGQTALFQALQESYNENVIRALIDAGADVNKADDDGQTVLFNAVKKSHDEKLVPALISAGADVKITDKYGRTALFYAVGKGYNKNVFRALIDAGASVNDTDKNDMTALFDAVQKSYNETWVGALIDAGADVKKTDYHGRTALFYAVRESFNENVIRALIDAGADINKTDNDGRTTLFYAVRIGYYNNYVVHTLIDTGADVNKTDRHGETALFYAVQQTENENMVRALIDAGADVNQTDRYDHRTALFCAVQQSNNESVARALIDAGAHINKTDLAGRTALFYAVQQSNNENVVRALIDAGADVNITNNNGQTALFCAVQQTNNKSVVCLLIETGKAFTNIRDFYGRTPLFYAYKCPTILEYLLGRLQNQFAHLKDSCNVSVVTVIIEKVVMYHLSTSRRGLYSVNGKTLDAASEHLDLLIKHGVKQERMIKTLLNLTFNKIPLMANFYNTNWSTVLHLASLCKKFLDFSSDASRKLEELLMMLGKDWKCENMLKALELLIELGADPSSADSDGNTVLHYITRLPFLGDIPQDIVMNMCYKLLELGVSFNMKNHEGLTPLLSCLYDVVSPISLVLIYPYGITPSALNTLIEVSLFIVESGFSVRETSRSGESIYHLLMNLFYKVLTIRDNTSLNVHETRKLFQIFTSRKVSRENIVNKPDDNLNSPVHLWACLALPYNQDYTSNITTDHTFETLLKEILQSLLEVGAKLNPRNIDEETPLHLCKTWSAVKLLIDAGANLKDVDSSGCSPLLARSKNISVFETTADYLYPDVTEDPKSFWKTTIDKGLDPWAVDQHGDSVLSFLVQSGNYNLSKALVDVACEDKYTQSETIFISLLNAICKDTSTRNHWKSVLVQDLLKSKPSVFTIPNTPLRFCCKNFIAEFAKADIEGIVSLDHDESFPEADQLAMTSKMQNSVHYEIAHLLICYGADPRSVDSSGKSCVDIAEVCPILKNLLTKPIDINSIAVVIPWTSVSRKHEDRLAKVARLQETEVVDSIWYHKDNIGSGSFGFVFAGINEKDGREVAIKRVETLRMTRPEDKREIENLTKLVDCEQVVRYLHFLEKGHFSFVVLELMEGNLDDYFQEYFRGSQTVELCKDVVLGVKFLHEQNIIHRDLKPTNILYKIHPKLCLKIADFGLSQRIDIFGKTTVYGTNAGTRCWIAPEVLKSGNHTKSSDVFSCGLLLHYILSKQKHAFSPVDCAAKTEFQVAFETEANVVKGTLEGWDSSLSPDANDLVKNMLVGEKNVIDRPTAEEALQHPLFWSKKKKIDFLIAVGNQPEFECPRAKRTPMTLTAIEADLEKNFGAIVRYGTWNDPRHVNMPAIYTEMTPPRRRTYDTSSVVELVRFIRNAHAHVSEDTRPEPFKKMLLEDFVFLEYFPQLVVEVYKVVTTHAWDQAKKEVKYVINK